MAAYVDSEGIPEANLKHLLDKKSLKWIFVGGKGGVGKTTTSCCLAIQLSKVRKNVLLISTDPAHNLSDAFNQQFTKNPTGVTGFSNLFAMEIDPNVTESEEFLEQTAGLEGGGGFLKDMVQSIPGIDEAMSFAEMMKQVQTMEFDVIVFDTAPTGHTLRLLAFPSMLGKGLDKIFEMKNKFSGLFQQFSGMMNLGINLDQMTERFETMKKVIEEVNKQFVNSDLTTFVCVCIPEFLSLYETERLIQELAKFQIDTESIVVNQVLFPEEGSTCGMCNARSKIQQKYLDQMNDLYGSDFHLVKLPLLNHEVRGTQRLEEFSKMLLK